MLACFSARAQDKEAFSLAESQEFRLTQKDASVARAAHHLEDYVDHLAVERQKFDAAMRHHDVEESVREKYEKQHEKQRRLAAFRAHYVPVEFMGETAFVQQDPIKYRTQFRFIASHINTVESLKTTRRWLLLEHVNEQSVHNKRIMQALRDAVLEQSRDANRLYDAMRHRDF